MEHILTDFLIIQGPDLTQDLGFEFEFGLFRVWGQGCRVQSEENYTTATDKSFWLGTIFYLNFLDGN